MNTLRRMIAVLLASILLISGITAAQDVSAGELQDALAKDTREADIAKREAETAVREAACFSQAIMLSLRCCIVAKVRYKAYICRFTDHCS